MILQMIQFLIIITAYAFVAAFLVVWNESNNQYTGTNTTYCNSLFTF